MSWSTDSEHMCTVESLSLPGGTSYALLAVQTSPRNERRSLWMISPNLSSNGSMKVAKPSRRQRSPCLDPRARCFNSGLDLVQSGLNGRLSFSSSSMGKEK
jgi:hypothetical protein